MSNLSAASWNVKVIKNCMRIGADIFLKSRTNHFIGILKTRNAEANYYVSDLFVDNTLRTYTQTERLLNQAPHLFTLQPPYKSKNGIYHYNTPSN